MAELVGLIASIGTIASGAISLAKALSAFADDMGSVGTQIRAISVDTKAVAWILHELKRRLDRATKINQQSLQVARDIADLCRLNINKIKEHLLPILPTSNGNISIAQKARWVFAKSKISTRKTALDSLKLTLTLFLHTLDFVEGDVVDEDSMREEIDDIIVMTKSTKTSFLNAARTDQMIREACEIADACTAKETGEDSANHEAVDNALKLLHSNIDSYQDGSALIVATCASTLGSKGSKTTATPTDLSEPQSSQRSNQSVEFQIIESLSDDSFLEIAQHIRTQKDVANYALIVLEGKHDGGKIDATDPTTQADTHSILRSQTPAKDLSESEGKPLADDPLSRTTTNVNSWSNSDDLETGSVKSKPVASVDGRNTPSFKDRHSRRREGNGTRSTATSTNRRLGYNGQNPFSPRPPTPRRPQYRMVPQVPTDGSYFGNEHSPTSHSDDIYTMPYNPVTPDYYPGDNPFASQAMPGQPWQPPPPPSPFSSTSAARDPPVDPEKEEMKKELAMIKKEQARRAAEAQQEELEARIREEAEQAFTRKMEQLRRDEENRAEERMLALENAKKEIEVARSEALEAARESIEKEKKAEVERAERDAQIRLETEMRLRGTMGDENVGQLHKRKVFRKLFA
ncbi:hypothetical protein F4678DRAFT_426700 [Xylaria arbuscula]|nr:hypothetical protein F4678DRAFT_426700 [Xylaria arbuscula]